MISIFTLLFKQCVITFLDHSSNFILLVPLACLAQHYILLLQKFAGDGLRTLCLAVKELDEETYEKWKVRHQEASYALF